MRHEHVLATGNLDLSSNCMEGVVLKPPGGHLFNPHTKNNTSSNWVTFPTSKNVNNFICVNNLICDHK
jgi:hypothetical protein